MELGWVGNANMGMLGLRTAWLEVRVERCSDVCRGLVMGLGLIGLDGDLEEDL